MYQVTLREDGSEVVRYDYEDYPAYVSEGLLSTFPNYAMESHWHTELEFIHVLEGAMRYNVNGEILELAPGDTLIVNSRRFHCGFSSEKRECRYLVALLHPMTLCVSPQLERRYVGPFLADWAPAYFLLRGDAPWEREVADGIRRIYQSREEESAPLLIQAEFYRLWRALYDNRLRGTAPRGGPSKRDQKLALLKDMVAYIKNNYRQKLTLEDIAKVGYLSKNGCLALFRRYLHETPINYLTRYRLKMGAELLANTKYSVTEIAYQVGFSGASYFTECFHRLYGRAPLEYRKVAGQKLDVRH